MKRIYVVRHAKSSWSDLTLSDKERPLNKRGKRDAPIMAERVKAMDASIDRLCCSSSQRTRDTAAYFLKKLSFTKVAYLDELYHAPYSDIISIIKTQPEEISKVMIMAHNPGCTDLYNHFSHNYLDNLPTCGIFVLDLDGRWADISTVNTRTTYLTYPKLV